MVYLRAMLASLLTALVYKPSSNQPKSVGMILEPPLTSSREVALYFVDSSDDPRRELGNSKVVDNHGWENGSAKKHSYRFGEVLGPPPSQPDAKLIDERLKIDCLEPGVVHR
jgi:hypothetical protein